MLLSRRTELALRTLERLAAPPAIRFDTGDVALDGIALHSLTVACAAERLAGEMALVYGRDAGTDPAEAFQCGLWHDLGKLALASAFPRAFGRVVEAAELVRGDFAEAERRVIGLDHHLAGKRVAERWGLPAAVRDCAWLHGQHPSAIPLEVANPRLVSLVTLADQIARAGRAGYSGNYGGFVPRGILCDALGIGEEQVSRAVEGLGEAVAAREGSVFLCKAESGKASFVPAPCNLQPLTASQRNSDDPSCSEALAAIVAFHAGQASDPSLSDVLASVAESASSVLNRSVAAFAPQLGRGYAETVVFKSDGELVHEGIAESTGWTVGSQDEPTAPAGDAPEWVLNDVGPHLKGGGIEIRFLPLRGGRETIGGLLFAATGAEVEMSHHPALIAAWSIAVRAAQVRDDARRLAERLAESNRRLQAAREEVAGHRAHAAVGEVAAGAAHEMNNPLMVISGRSQLLASSLTDPKHKAAAQQIAEQSQRLSDMITSLMDYARPRPPRLETVDLIGLIDRARAIAKRQTGPADRTVVVSIAPEVPPVSADAEQLAEAVGEVLANAYQATGPAGRIEITGRYDAYCGRVVLAVSDDGCGMAGETLAHAFDPFFSAKPAGRRRGMGLATALRKVEAGGGSLRLEADPGRGARATFLLPAADVVAPAAGRRKSA